MAKRPQNLPAFDRPQLEAINRRLQALDIPSSSREMIMRSLNAAANPQVETPEFGIKALPKERRKIAEQSAQEVGAIFSFSNNVAIDYDQQVDYNAELAQAQADNSKLSWETVAALLLLYFLFPQEQATTLYDSILNAYVSAWQSAISEQASRYGCPYASVGNPPLASMVQLREWAKRDSDSIVSTYNTEAQNALKKLYEANPLGSVAYYLDGMASWSSTRQQRKNLTIGINNAQAGYQLGLQDFHVNNKLETKYAFSGAPPICPICVGLFSMGHVDYATMAYNAAPAHPNCPHYWVSVNTYTIACDSMWTGV